MQPRGPTAALALAPLWFKESGFWGQSEAIMEPLRIGERASSHAVPSQISSWPYEAFYWGATRVPGGG